MKVFLSWSGSESKQLAGIFKEWLPNVLQYIEPYMSAEDISLGERWNNNITDSLEEAVFGLIFVTPSNINAPWINFEAGALSKTYDSKVVPILYNADVMILNQGPLKQFQSAKNLDEESVLSLIKSINQANGSSRLDESRLDKAFEMWWPNLKKSIDGIEKEEKVAGAEEAKGPTEKELLNVIYSKLMEQEKAIFRNQSINQMSPNIPPGLIRDLDRVHALLKDCGSYLAGGPYPDELFESIGEGLSDLEHAIGYLEGKKHKSLNIAGKKTV
ncbi:TIR domain-containing protein [Bacillus cereus group sp. Bce025]|uniref:TIR domain-containing protein n=1 Tax=Bacillus cereus TaxID=1396 RepID=UPI000B4B927F|nr:TIR domain-containing protein [Bacillus cereus]MDA2478424.1 TIR domain-containing protein [Bacillus cereus]MDA2495499.1 TIR domain-containing protein [Bacillus cereus]